MALNLPAAHRVAYGEDPLQFGDLYLPGGSGPHPVVILIHGGFWRAAYDLQHIGHLASALARAGFACWSLEYRRIGNQGGGWPGTMLDVAQGAAHLRRLSGEHALDTARIAAVGHSAGGHLALWLGGACRLPEGRELAPGGLPPLRGVISLAGVSDLRRAFMLKLGNGVVEQFLEATPQEQPDRYAQASPVERLPLGLTQVLLHGEDDDVVPLEISVGYVAAARLSGDPAELVVLKGAGHFELIDPVSSAFPVLVENLSRLLA